MSLFFLAHAVFAALFLIGVIGYCVWSRRLSACAAVVSTDSKKY